jgi:iron complex transport system ATP-binding protein
VKRNDLTVILALCDINFALWYSNKFILLKGGTIFTAGEHEDITPETIETVYGFRVNAINHMGRLIMMPL